MSATYAYPRPALTVDCVVFGLDDEGLKVLCIERELPPFEGAWALPGGFVRVGEALEEAARRELQEETGLEKVYLEQLYTFGAPDRDPREHTVSSSPGSHGLGERCTPPRARGKPRIGPGVAPASDHLWRQRR